MILTAEQGLEPIANYANCTYNRDDITRTTVTCLIARSLAPGATLTVTAARNPLMLKVQEDAGGPYTYAATLSAVDLPDEQADALSAKPGPRLTATTTPGLPSATTRAATFGVRVATSTTTLQATGAAITEGTTTVTVGLRNTGTTATVPDSSPTVRVTMPTGVKVTQVAKGCTADLSAYTCTTTQRLRPSQSALFDFTIEVTSTDRSAGQVALPTGDTAEIAWVEPMSHRTTLPLTGALTASALLATGVAAAFLITRRRSPQARR